MARPYEVMRRRTLTMTTEGPDGEPVASPVEAWVPVGIFEASGDEQACKAACASQVKEGALNGDTSPEYLAVAGRSFHRHTMAIRNEPQIGFAK